MKHYVLPTSYLTLVVIMLLTFSSSAALVAPPRLPISTGTVDSPRAQAISPAKIYLPLTVNRYPHHTIFGIEMKGVTPARGLDGVVATSTTWIRRNGLLWKDVEPVEDGGYKWNAPSVQALEQEMINARNNNFKLIMIVRGSPRWATAPHQADCAPINPRKYASFARFMKAAVERYSKPPYSVQFWELGNEPDGPIATSDSVWGCWGDPKDPYYGGRAYGNMLKAVYPAMKAANPDSKVLNGGLLLDRPYNPQNGSGLSARFIEGVFVAGAASSFDILSYHSYSHYNGNPDGTMGSTDWKVGYLRNLMKTYNVRQKPLFNTESALLCHNADPSQCRQPQANFIAKTYARAMKDRLMGLIWYAYDSDSFRSTALVEPTNVSIKRPAYHAYKHAARMIGGTEYLGRLEQQPSGVEGYRFRRGSETVIIFWSNTERSITIPVPSRAAVSCTNRDGGTVACTNVNGSVTLIAKSSPRYIVVR